ncbi:MAG: hypothetical protein AVDCRST_MAG95-33 [uncultured Adhaeribacter sp.]|uniref:Uncharacterized protein n=1 Tax=uncultured Adhaeribacter sp. TaxID=448109 RepID=A0A6J4GYW5_9BACT|nr:MAG: hypothetical protein AVDCRST_MAG95-33 [uncultured Adhaeribacter sp.]
MAVKQQDKIEKNKGSKECREGLIICLKSAYNILGKIPQCLLLQP